jgi:hypothetical protein
MKIKLLLLLLFYSCLTQSQDILWGKSYGGLHADSLFDAQLTAIMGLYRQEEHPFTRNPISTKIDKNGLILAEMNMSLLKKVEELTFCMIEQSSEIETLKKGNKSFKTLSKRFSKIESQLKTRK